VTAQVSLPDLVIGIEVKNMEEILNFGNWCLSGDHYFVPYEGGGYWHMVENRKYTIEEIYEYWKGLV
jgi:hypothetical protein